MPKGLELFDESKHGVSYTLLSDWLTCREKARLKLAGWRSREPKLALSFGSIFHTVIETGYREIAQGELQDVPSHEEVAKWIGVAEAAWRKEHKRATPEALETLELSLLFATAVLPMYFEYWEDDIFAMTFEQIEQFFSVPFKLPNGRWINIKGKWDAIYKLGKGDWLQESKSSSRIDVEILPDLLPLSMQSRMYLLLYRWKHGENLRGFLRDIIRRPNLRRGKKERIDEYAARCVKDAEERPDHYFHRYEISMGKDEIDEFETEFRFMLEDFWRWRWDNVGHYRNTNECKGKYGLCSMFNICARKDFSRHVQMDWAKKEEGKKRVKVRRKKRRRSDGQTSFN